MERKIKLIKRIAQRHPSAGVEKGWSTYVGGMADTGQWFFEKMVDFSEEEIESFLISLLHSVNVPPTPLTPEEERQSKIIHRLQGGAWMTELELRNYESFARQRDADFLFKAPQK